MRALKQVMKVCLTTLDFLGLYLKVDICLIFQIYMQLVEAQLFTTKFRVFLMDTYQKLEREVLNYREGKSRG